VERFGIQPSLGLSWAAVPLIVDSGVIGVLAASYSVRRSFSDADQLELLALAGQCAQALERARLYEAERRSRLFLAEAEHIARLGSWEYDVAEDRVTWSDQLWRIFGLEPHSQSLCFNSYADRIHPNDLEAEQRKLDALAREGTEDAFMHRIITDAGEVRWIRGVRRVKRDSNNNVTSLFGYAQDVSEQQALQEQLLQAQKMEAVGQLAGGIAHDFNNLLTAILSYSDLLQAELENSDPKWADVEEIRKAALRASTLTRQLLAFSRRQILRSSAFNLNSVLMDMQPMLGRLIGEDIVLSLSLQDDLPKIVADRSQVEQVIMNLVVNSRDAMPDGGAIVLATEYHTGPQATLLVRDTGTGMDEATRSRIFEPFFTTKELGKGTGLGMSTVQGIIQQSGGDIDVVSAPGKGTTVRVSLPLATEVDGERGIVKENADGHEGDETILLVEDEERVRNATSRILQAHGYTVLIATNAAEAIQLLDYDASQVDLVLTDVVLPGMSGIELASVLAERKIDLPVVLVSGYAEEELNRRSGGFAMTDVLNKPYSREELLARIRLALDARQEG
jgi:two-component system, cell cycle sensor histidine kinase and response regulator CckA